MALGLNNDKNDLSRKLDGFVSSREFGQQNPVVDKFFSARSESVSSIDLKSYEDRLAERERNQSVFDDSSTPKHSTLLKKQSGTVMTGGYNTGDTVEDQRRAERKKETDSYVNQMSQAIQRTSSTYSSFRFSVSQEEAQSIMARRAASADKMEQAYEQIGTPVTVDIQYGQADRRQVVIDGKTYTVNSIGYIFDETGKSLNADQETALLASRDPDAAKVKALVDIRRERDSTAHVDNQKLHTFGEEQSMANYEALMMDIDARRQDMTTATANVDQWMAENPNVKREFIVDGERVVMDDKGRFRDPNGEIVASSKVEAVMQPGEEKVLELRDLMLEKNVAGNLLTSSERTIAERQQQEAVSTAPRTASATGPTGMVGEQPISKQSTVSAFNSSAAGTASPAPAADNEIAAPAIAHQIVPGQSMRIVGGL